MYAPSITTLLLYPVNKVNFQLPAGFEDWVTRIQFGSHQRIELYDALSTLVENGTMVTIAIEKMEEIYSSHGKKKGDPRARILRDCLDKINRGVKLSDALGPWVSYEEKTIISSGEKSGDLVSSFNRCISLISKKGEIRGALLGLTYPAFLMVMAGYMLNLIATKLIPKLARTVNPELAEGSVKTLFNLAYFVNNYGMISIISIVVMAILIAISLGNLRGSIRIVLDRVYWSPWGIYKMIHGSIFLTNMAVLVRSGVQVKDALLMLRDQASPWLKERIDGAIYGTKTGGNLGQALNNSGYEFPDKRAVEFLMVLAGNDGFDQAMERFANRWMDSSITKMQSASKVLLALGLVIIGSIMIVTISGFQGIQDAIQQKAR